jgi:hypothetical protein
MTKLFAVFFDEFDEDDDLGLVPVPDVFRTNS